MKLLTLNTWGGRVFTSLVSFIKDLSLDVDIFCFQEVFNTSSKMTDFTKNGISIRANLLKEFSTVLPEFDCVFSPSLFGISIDAEPVDFDLKMGLAVFFKKSFACERKDEYFLYGSGPTNKVVRDFSNAPTNLQHLRLLSEGTVLDVFNFHGTSRPGSKLDTPRRIDQSLQIKEIMRSCLGKRLIAGDFNLLPTTKSIQILETEMSNLIKDFNIQNTRSPLNIVNGKLGDQKFADYLFVSGDIRVKSFEALEVKVSDHLPLLLDFE